MADYYALMAKAAAGLPQNTAAARRALYERARGALRAQLRAMDPPMTRSAMDDECLALEEAIRRVELAAAPQPRGQGSPPATRNAPVTAPGSSPSGRPRPSSSVMQTDGGSARAPLGSDHRPGAARKDAKPTTPADTLKEWREAELGRASSLPLACPHCSADLPDDVSRCPKCNRTIGGFWPPAFLAVRIGAAAAIVGGVIWLAVRFGHFA
jgi:hypothetical protein